MWQLFASPDNLMRRTFCLWWIQMKKTRSKLFLLLCLSWWNVFLGEYFFPRKQELLNSHQVANSSATEWIICQYGFVGVSLEITLSLSHRNTLLVNSCSFQNLCWFPAGMIFLNVCSDCHQPVGWLNIPTGEKGVVFMISWSLKYGTALVQVCCGIHKRLRFLSRSAVSVSILCLASVLVGQTSQAAGTWQGICCLGQ